MLSPFARLDAGDVHAIALSSGAGDDVIVRSIVLDEALEDADQLLLLGRGYESEEAAQEGGERWRGYLERALARVQMGADFGDRVSPSYMAPEFLETLAEQRGVERVLTDEFGVMVFEEEPWPEFARMSVAGVVRHPVPRLVRAIEKACEISASLSDRDKIAFDLYSASMFVSSLPDARFLTLMMALETLIEQSERSSAAVAHVEQLIQQTQGTELPRDEISSLLGSLRLLRYESISQAGRRLVRTLGDRTYDRLSQQSPEKFFNDCYDLRSRLVHGTLPRPTFNEVNGRIGGLELMVSHLLSGDLLDVFDIEG